MSSWTLHDARRIYNVLHWGGGYFDINPLGHLEARPRRDATTAAIDLHQLALDINATAMSYPILVRFTDILHDRVDTLYTAFAKAIEAEAYQGRYQAVYPIKVNQQRSVVEAIFSHGQGRVGLEAGSKPELMVVLALMDQQGGVIVCNGYKDREYIRLALIGRAMGHRVFIVIEKPSELELVIEESRKLGIRPLLGVRAKLASIGAGKWQNTGGEKSKFGLSAAQVLHAVERLRAADMLDSLQMVHFHLGSQIPNIRDIQRGMRECARYYAELHRLGAKVDVVDVGGGLGIDYEGTRSRSFCSMNYSVEEYANNIVRALWEICREHNLPHPDIISESGRALTAHHAMLITNVIDTGQVPNPKVLTAPAKDAPLILHDLWDSHQTLLQADSSGSARSLIEVYHDIHHHLSGAQDKYNHGLLSLVQRAYAEDVYYAACWAIQERLQPHAKQHREILDELHDKLSDKYFCNFSLFQSMPDVWAIDQIFPVVPLQRLNEAPQRRAVIEDITCDSDGRIDLYVDNEGVESSLPLHAIQPGETYLLGMFLVGAYQEILGDMHNLFGDTDSVDVELTGEGGYRIVRPIRGDTVDSVLRFVHFDVKDLQQRYRSKMSKVELPPAQRDALLAELEGGLYGYTYLEE
ncbi:MAG: biosynthetic arginine decarboxylase [Gammaproteobacteria bacterium]|nr:biosynthetic arginine decarboxylase [Gammaproteobacteria bacterium]